MDSLIKLCRLHREATGLSQRDIANKVGLSRSWVAGVEAGTRNCAADKFLAYVDACGVQLTARPKDTETKTDPGLVAAGQP